MGAKFYDYIKSNELMEVHITSPENKNILDLNSFIHGAELKSYEFNLYKSKKITK